jgi:hypothetical protein
MENIVLPTRKLDETVLKALNSLKAGDKFRVTQTVRVGAKTWSITTNGIFRHLSYLSTGVTTDRIPEDDIIVPTVHFKKDNGELASISLDDKTKIEKV